MYDIQLIQDEFMGLVGLRQTDNPAFDLLSDDIVKSANNVLIQHPLLNIENLDMTARNYGNYEYDDWDSGDSYDEGDRVRGSDENVYESLEDANVNNDPVSSPDEWRLVSLLSLYLEDVFRSGVDDVVNDLVNEKKLRRESKKLLDNVILFEGIGSKNDLIVNESSLVGFAVQVKHSRNLMALVKRIGHHFTESGALQIWIYHSSQNEAVATVNITRTKAYSFEWTDAGLNFRHMSENYDAGGTFFLMYNQDNAPGQAIRKNQQWPPCSTCSGYDKRAWNLYTKFMSIYPVKVALADRALAEGSESDPDTLWDINKTVRVNDTNWGLNLELMAQCDLTDLLIQHKDSFAFALRDKITIKLMEHLANSTRQNGVETLVAKQATIALQMASVGGGGLKEAYTRQLKAVDFEFSGFNDVCLPCNNAAGLSWGATSLRN